MSGVLRELSTDDFDAAVAKGVTVVDFWAPWCGPCKMQSPILDRVADAVAGKAAIVKVNIEDHNDLAGRFGVRSIPTILIFKDGKVIQTFVGMQLAEDLVRAVAHAG